MNEIHAAVMRYRAAKMAIPGEWLEEYVELASRAERGVLSGSGDER